MLAGIHFRPILSIDITLTLHSTLDAPRGNACFKHTHVQDAMPNISHHHCAVPTAARPGKRVSCACRALCCMQRWKCDLEDVGTCKMGIPSMCLGLNKLFP